MNVVKNNQENRTTLQESHENNNLKLIILRNVFNSFTICKKLLKLLSYCNEKEEFFEKEIIRNGLEKIFNSNDLDISFIEDIIHWKENFRLLINTKDDFERCAILKLQDKMLSFMKKVIEKLLHYNEMVTYLSLNENQNNTLLMKLTSILNC